MYKLLYPSIRVRTAPLVSVRVRVRVSLRIYCPDPNRYRRRCPDPNARIQKFIHYIARAVICDSGPLR